MARKVRMTATGPIKIEPQDKPIFICACGLTKNPPFCDASHKKCRDEPEGKCFVYDAEHQRVEIPE
ncbi:MAG: CDGSH iron-sulfur domain-containing protein [Planctomycetes bacterium]|nr:CDGSH iron-sulfur domain-containing protein [Planctomycetota bacterium]